MGKNDIVSMLLVITVGIIMAGALLAPVISGVSDSLTVIKHNDYGVFSDVADEDASISISYADSTVTYTLNGTAVDVDASESTVLFASDVMNVIYLDGSNFLVTAAADNSRHVGQTSVNLSLSNGTLTGTSSDGETTHSYTFNYEWAFCYNSEGDYRALYLLSDVADTIYYTDLDEIYGSNFVFTTNKYFSFRGDTVNYYTSGGTYTTLTADVDYSNVSGTQDMKSFDVSRTGSDYTFVVDNNGEDYTVNPWIFVVPYTVESDSIANPDSLISLLYVIPVLVILAIMMYAVVYIRKD